VGHALAEGESPPRIIPKVDEILSKLRANPPLHEALSAYFAHDLDVAVTAASLHMHRNSLPPRAGRAGRHPSLDSAWLPAHAVHP
jgi:sugar diacid utilization regulator